ncbi:MAG: hypothetical protein HY420_00550 [Candidatus Kerfeldbacteria bacterium]|nr:hypothetical protein [Candidatus Kerfeldbacteria bacterium]
MKPIKRFLACTLFFILLLVAPWPQITPAICSFMERALPLVGIMMFLAIPLIYVSSAVTGWREQNQRCRGHAAALTTAPALD